jgi:methionine sulfoxide reductase catalytic subunit
MHGFVRRPWDISQSLHTPIKVFRMARPSRREFLRGLVASSLALAGCQKPPTDEELTAAGAVTLDTSKYPARRAAVFEYGRDETRQRETEQFANFYEFAASKDVFRYVAGFNPTPWSVEVTGLCQNPRTYDLDQIVSTFPLEERAYRHRCVETWAMCVPWTGFALKDLVIAASPLPTAKYVRFETFMRPTEATPQQDTSYPWPYQEGLTLEEATNDLAFIATGIYGTPLPKQNGAPLRLVVPWKYGFKSIKSIVKIEFVAEQPTSFWNTLNPHEYAFEANVDPAVPHPRWSQQFEWMLGTRENFDTVKYNGYGDWVAKLYEKG